MLGASTLVSPASAAPPASRYESLHVLELAYQDEREAARALTEALRQRVHVARDYALGDSDLSLKVAAAPCQRGPLFDREGAPREPTPACLGQVGAALQDKLQARKPPFLWGHLTRDAAGRRRVQLHLWREGQADARVDYVYEATPTGARAVPLEDVAEWLLRRLVDGEARTGRVRVRAAGTLEGDLYADGEERGRLEAGGSRELVLAPGIHALEVRRGERVVAQARVLARAGDEPPPVQPMTLPAATAPARAPLPSPAPVATSTPPERTAWPWVFGGIGVAGLATAGLLFVLRQDAEGDLDRACDVWCHSRERSTIERSNRLGSGALLALSSGVAGLAAGVTLWAFESQSTAPRAGAGWRVRGTVGALGGGAGLGLQGHF
jgi:hypothetical protein